MLIAVATQSGTLVDQAFGQTSQFMIYDYADRQVVKTVKVDPFGVDQHCCGPQQHPFDVERFTAIARALSGCKAVVVKKIGDTPKKHLVKAGFAVVESSAAVELAMKQAHDQVCPGGCKSSEQGCKQRH